MTWQILGDSEEKDIQKHAPECYRRESSRVNFTNQPPEPGHQEYCDYIVGIPVECNAPVIQLKNIPVIDLNNIYRQHECESIKHETHLEVEVGLVFPENACQPQKGVAQSLPEGFPDFGSICRHVFYAAQKK